MIPDMAQNFGCGPSQYLTLISVCLLANRDPIPTLLTHLFLLLGLGDIEALSPNLTMLQTLTNILLLQALHDAVLNGSERLVQLLLEAGAEPASKDGAGETPLSLAVLVGQWGCAEALLRSPGGAGAVQVTANRHVHIHACAIVCLGHSQCSIPACSRIETHT
jgi:ankyrin repeat protein